MGGGVAVPETVCKVSTVWITMSVVNPAKATDRTKPRPMKRMPLSEMVEKGARGPAGEADLVLSPLAHTPCQDHPPYKSLLRKA